MLDSYELKLFLLYVYILIVMLIGLIMLNSAQSLGYFGNLILILPLHHNHFYVQPRLM